MQVGGSELIAEKIERDLAQSIDAGDNGISLTSENQYGVYPAELFSVVSSYIPGWGSDASIDDAFLEAVDFAYDYLGRIIARGKADEAMQQYAAELYEAAENKEIIIADKMVSSSAFVQYPEVKAVISPREGEEKWMVSLVSTGNKTFERRVSFPASWSALKDGELETVSGIEGAIFCHKNLFLFVADSKEAALAAAEYLE